MNTSPQKPSFFLILQIYRHIITQHGEIATGHVRRYNISAIKYDRHDAENRESAIRTVSPTQRYRSKNTAKHLHGLPLPL